MTKVARRLTVITILVFALFLAAVLGMQLNARLASVTVQSAGERIEEFNALMDAVRRGDLGDMQFKAPADTDPEAYSFVTYSVQLSSFCILPAEWALVCLSPLEGDVALLQSAPGTVSPLGGATITATLLTENAYAAQERSVWTEYYVFGRFMAATAKKDA